MWFFLLCNTHSVCRAAGCEGDNFIEQASNVDDAGRLPHCSYFLTQCVCVLGGGFRLNWTRLGELQQLQHIVDLIFIPSLASLTQRGGADGPRQRRHRPRSSGEWRFWSWPPHYEIFSHHYEIFSHHHEIFSHLYVIWYPVSVRLWKRIVSPETTDQHHVLTGWFYCYNNKRTALKHKVNESERCVSTTDSAAHQPWGISVSLVSLCDSTSTHSQWNLRSTCVRAGRQSVKQRNQIVVDPETLSGRSRFPNNPWSVCQSEKPSQTSSWISGAVLVLREAPSLNLQKVSTVEATKWTNSLLFCIYKRFSSSAMAGASCFF